MIFLQNGKNAEECVFGRENRRRSSRERAPERVMVCRHSGQKRPCDGKGMLEGLLGVMSSKPGIEKAARLTGGSTCRAKSQDEIACGLPCSEYF